MRLIRASVVAALCAGSLVLGCALDETHFPPAEDCTGAACTSGGTKGSGTTTTSGTHTGTNTGTGGAAGIISQSGTVEWADNTFKPIGVKLTQPAAVQANSQVVGMTSAPVTSGAFQFPQLTTGSWWFVVRDDGTTPLQIMPTITSATLPVSPSLTLPVLHDDVLPLIAQTIPSLAGKTLGGSHVVLYITHNSAPVSGAKVKPGTGGAVIAYETAAGFDETATATGSTGLVLLLNSTLSSYATITVTDAAAVDHSVGLYAVANAATILTVDLP
jgi:hypothetical protein